MSGKQGEPIMIKDAIAKVIEGKDLGSKEAQAVMDEIMSGKCTDAQIGSYLTALRMKGETIEEVAGSVLSMRSKMLKVKGKRSDAVDTCGTGGDGSGTFNISTAAALVTAAAGVPVAKHGNRAVSSACGSADVLAELGIKTALSPSVAKRCLDKLGFCFLFAPAFHGAMKHAIGPRREIAIKRTIFNLMGPMSNPAGVKRQTIGVGLPLMLKIMPQVLKVTGSTHVMVYCSENGMDELSTTAKARVAELRGGKVRNYTLDPVKLGLKRSTLGALRGGGPTANAKLIRRLLAGEKGAKRDTVLLSAGAAIYVGGKAASIKKGMALAAEAIDSGAATRLLAAVVEFTARAS